MQIYTMYSQLTIRVLLWYMNPTMSSPRFPVENQAYAL